MHEQVAPVYLVDIYRNIDPVLAKISYVDEHGLPPVVVFEIFAEEECNNEYHTQQPKKLHEVDWNEKDLSNGNHDAASSTSLRVSPDLR